MKRELKEHFLILIALVLLSSLAWTGTVYQAGSMGLGMITCSMTMGTPFSVGNALLYVLLWGVMMVAMMFPAIVPVVGLFSTIAGRKREQGVPFTPAWVFVAGYLVLWTLAGGVGYTVDLAIQSLPEVFPALRTYGLVIGGLTLIAAGVYQLTPLKYLCLSQCRSYQLAGRRPGCLSHGPAPRRLLSGLLLEPDGSAVRRRHHELGVDGHPVDGHLRGEDRTARSGDGKSNRPGPHRARLGNDGVGARAVRRLALRRRRC